MGTKTNKGEIDDLEIDFANLARLAASDAQEDTRLLLWLRVGGYAAAGVAALLGYLWLATHYEQRGYQRAQAEYAAALSVEKQRALQAERSMTERYREAQNARIESEKQLDAHRRAARVADDRLRDATNDFGQRLSATTAETARHAASTAAQLLGECVGRYREVAAAADGHAADAEQCQAAWPNAD